MELIGVLHVLRRRRTLVMVGVLVAVAAGLAAIGRLPAGPGAVSQHVTALGETRVFVDTPEPLAIDLRADAHTIGLHVALLADLMAEETRVEAIARAAGVPAGDLIVLRPAMTAPAERGQLGERIAEAPAGRPYSLTVTASVALPIVSLDARAPDGRTAARLAEAGTEVLTQIAADKGPTAARRLEVESLEPVTVTEELTAGGRSGLIAIAVALVTFILWCSGVVIAGALVRAWRRPAPVAQGTAG